MKISERLREEFNSPREGRFLPAYFRFLGYREHISDPISILRARGIESLFTLHEPHIFVNDLIVGNTVGLWCEIERTLRKSAESLASTIGSRHFGTNKDHFSPNYGHILKVGINGIIGEIDRSLEIHREDRERCETLQAMRITVEAFKTMIANYVKKAKSLFGDPRYDCDRLEFIISNCETLLVSPPQSFAQGLQLVWLCHTAFMLEERYAMALGRMDQYLYELYQKDLASGNISYEKALELFENTFTKIPTNDVVNICIGGMGADRVCRVNELSYCIVNAVKNCNAPGPNLSARITPDTPDEFLRVCLESIGTGLGYPALMNDAVNVAALEKIGYEWEDVCDYSMVGCIENFITGKQPPWSDGRFDTPRFFDYVFNNGISSFSTSTGIDTGNIEDIKSMDDFMRAFSAQLEYGAAVYCASFRSYNDSVNQKYYAEPFLSCFCEDCIGRGLDINDGGSKYPSVHGAALMGVGTTADSLAAIEKVVFTDREATLADVRDAIQNNFEGYEELRRKLINAPKYGNNDDFVDKYAVWFLDYISSLFRKYKTRDGGAIYVAMAANTSNIWAGKTIAATPDGRLQGEPLSDAASPTYGRDKKGATVTLNSVSKPDYTLAACGTVVNQKFSPSMFKGDKLARLLALVRGYFVMGGQEIQINATSRQTLLDAMEDPEKYQSLVVRVSGFSDYYVRLAKDVQLDILNRTQHE